MKTLFGHRSTTLAPRTTYAQPSESPPHPHSLDRLRGGYDFPYATGEDTGAKQLPKAALDGKTHTRVRKIHHRGYQGKTEHSHTFSKA